MEMQQQFVTWWAAQQRPVRRIAVLTGAGISAESGIPTFRGKDGFWRKMDPAELFSLDALARDPRLVWEMYDDLRGVIARSEPNDGHRALATLGHRQHVALITQNIDGLHQRAGSHEVLELHGNMWRLRCDQCRYQREDEEVPLPALPPRCPACRAVLRPDIVLFGEMLPTHTLQRAVQAAERCDVMLVVGTSGVVYPAAGLPGVAAGHGALLIEVNPVETALSGDMHYVVRASAAEALPWVVTLLEGVTG